MQPFLMVVQRAACPEGAVSDLDPFFPHAMPLNIRTMMRYFLRLVSSGRQSKYTRDRSRSGFEKYLVFRRQWRSANVGRRKSGA
jgi:hypothetical protein